MWKKLETKRYFTAALLVLSITACKGRHSPVTVQNEEQEAAPRLLSTVRTNDPSASAQLLSGFFPIEAGAWRWTAGKFSVLLRTPPAAAQSGAALSFSFTLPEVVLKQV